MYDRDAKLACFKASISLFCLNFITELDFKRADFIIKNIFEYLLVYEFETQFLLLRVGFEAAPQEAANISAF